MKRSTCSALVMLAGLAMLGACAHAPPHGGPPPTGVVSRADLRRMVDSLLQSPTWSRAQWGVLVIDTERGDTLVARGAQALLIPASNQKLITAAVALAELGPDFRFSTLLATSAPVRDSVLEGDLIVLGSGDPSFTDAIRGDARAALASFADSLRTHGIARIRGVLRPGPAYFADAPLGSGWEWDDLGAAYAASVGELMYENAFAPTQIFVGVDSLGRSRRSSGLRFLDALAAVLAERGMLDHDASTAVRVSTAPVDTLIRFSSPALGALLPHFLKPSQNQMGEILLKTLGRVGAGAARADSGAAVVQRRLTAWGVAPDAVVVRDGSGLSRHNLVSADALAMTLYLMSHSPSADIFRDALPVASVDGTLERRLTGTAAAGNLRAKSGSMDRVRALSGYLADADGRELVMVLMVNHFPGSTASAEAALDSIAARVARSRRIP